jgi:hypothetical protein
VTPRRPDRLGTPETNRDTADLVILIAFLVLLLAVGVVVWAAVEGKLT